MNKKNSLVNRILALLLAVVMIFSNSLTSQAAWGTRTGVYATSGLGGWSKSYGQLVVIPVVSITDLAHSRFKTSSKSNRLLQAKEDYTIFEKGKDSSEKTLYIIPNIPNDGTDDWAIKSTNGDANTVKTYIEKKIRPEMGSFFDNSMFTIDYAEALEGKTKGLLTSDGAKNKYKKKSLTKFLKSLHITCVETPRGNSSSQVAEIINAATSEAQSAFNKCEFFHANIYDYNGKGTWKQALYNEIYGDPTDVAAGSDDYSLLYNLEEDTDITRASLNKNNPLIFQMGFLIYFIPCTETLGRDSGDMLSLTSYGWASTMGSGNNKVNNIEKNIKGWLNIANGGNSSGPKVSEALWGIKGSKVGNTGESGTVVYKFSQLNDDITASIFSKKGFANKKVNATVLNWDGEVKKQNVGIIDSRIKSISGTTIKASAKAGEYYLLDCKKTSTDVRTRGAYIAVCPIEQPDFVPEKTHIGADMIFKIDSDTNNVSCVASDVVSFELPDKDEVAENTAAYTDFKYSAYDATWGATGEVEVDGNGDGITGDTDDIFAAPFNANNKYDNIYAQLQAEGYQKFGSHIYATKEIAANSYVHDAIPYALGYTVKASINTRPVQGGTLVTSPAMKSNKDATMSTTALNIGKSESLIGVSGESTYGSLYNLATGQTDASGNPIERYWGTTNYANLTHMIYCVGVDAVVGSGLGTEAGKPCGQYNGENTYWDKDATETDVETAPADGKVGARWLNEDITGDGVNENYRVGTGIEVWHKFGSVTSQLVTVPIQTSFDSISGTYTGTVGNIEQKASATYLTSCCADFTLPSDTVAVVAIPNAYYTADKLKAIKSVRSDDMRVENMVGKIIDTAESGVPATSKLSCTEGISGGEHFCTGEENKDGYTIICITSPSHLDIKIKTDETDAEGVLYGQVVIRSYQLNKFTADIMNYCTGFDHALTTQSEVGTTYKWKDFYLQGKEYSDTADKEYTYNYKGKDKEFDDETHEWVEKEVDKTATIKFTNVKKLDLGTYFEAKQKYYEDSFHTPSSTWSGGDSVTHKVECNGGRRSVVNNIYGTEEITLNSAVTALSYTFNTKIWQTLSGVKPTSDAYYYNTGFAEEVPDKDGTMQTLYVGGNFVTAASFNSKASQMFSTWRKSDLNGTTFKASASSGTNHEDIGVLTYAVETRRKDFGDKKTISSISKQTTVKQSVKQSDGTYKDEDINVAVELSGLNAPHNTPQDPSKVNTKNKNVLLADIKTSTIKWNSALQGYNIYNSDGDLDIASTNKRNLARSAAFCRREVTPLSATGNVKSYYLDGYITNSMYNEENLPKLLAYFNSRVNATKILQDLYVGKTNEIYGYETNRYGELLSKYQEAKNDLNNSEIDYGTGLYKKTELDKEHYAEYFNNNVKFTPGSSTSDEYGRLWEFTLFNGRNAGAVEMYYTVLKNSDKSNLVTSDAALNKKNYPELSKDGSYSKFNVFNLDKESPSIHRSIHFDGTGLDYKSVTFSYHERALKYSPSYKGVKTASDYKEGTNSYKDALVKNTLATSGKADGTLVFRDGVIGDTEIKKASPTAKLYDINSVAEYATGKSDATATSANDYNWVALMYYPEVQMAYYSTLQKDKITSLDDVSRHITKVMADEQRKSYSSGLYIYSINTGLSDANSSQHTDDKYIVNPANTDDSVKGATISSGYQVTTKKDTNPIAYAGSDITLNVDANFTINLYGYALDVTDKNNEGRADIEANVSATPPVQAQSFGYTVSTKAVKKSEGLSTLANGYETEKTGLEKYSDMEKHIADDSDIYSDWKNWTETVTEGENTITKRNTDRLLEQYRSWADSMLNTNNYEARLSLEVKDGGIKSKEYDEFNVSFGKLALVEGGKITKKTYNSKNNNKEDGTYALNFENGELIRFRKDKTATGDTEEYYDSSYLALITQIADDSNLSLKEADEMFMNSNLYTAVLNAIQSSTNPASENGSGFDDLGKTDSDKHLGNKDNWYDERVKTIVVRRFKTDSVTLSGIVCQDKLDYNITSAGSQKKYTGEWYFSTRLVNVDKTGIGTAGNLWASTNTAGEKYIDIINHNHIAGADFDIRNSSQDAGN